MNGFGFCSEYNTFRTVMYVVWGGMPSCLIIVGGWVFGIGAEKNNKDVPIDAFDFVK
jgi:hypothetical protein